MKNMQRSWVGRHRFTLFSSGTIAALLILSIALIPHVLSIHAQPRVPQYAKYIPSTAFGDTDDLPGNALHSRVSMAAGSSGVSGVVTDASTGQPVANATVGISAGAVGSAAQYATTAADGSYSFSSISSGTYNLSAWRYVISGTQPMYKDAQQMQVSVGSSATVNFKLTPITVPGSRTVPSGHAKNLIIVDFDETYYDAWFTDAQSMANSSPNTHQLAQTGVNGTEMWTSYGWSPIDHYQIAVGSYPAWRSPDAPAQVWGQPDGLDTNIWYGGTEEYGQESVFDVAKSYGMNTAVIGGNDYPTGHITDANVDQITLGQNINGVPTQWTTEVENFITGHASNPNGFLVYMPITEAEGSSIENTSPDTSGSLYQQASNWDDQGYGELYTWLQQNNYLSNTAIAITSDEAENDHTSYDNFYGAGSTGGGSTRHVPFVFAGPGVVVGQSYSSVMNSDDMSANFMYELNLPSPIDSRGHVVPALFTTGGTPVPTPSPTSTGTPSPSPTPTGTTIPSPTTTATPSPTGTTVPSPTSTNPPSPTPTIPTGNNLIQNGGFESGTTGWTYGGSPSPKRSKTEAHSGSYSLKVGGSSGQSGDSTASQTVTIPASARHANLSFYYWPASNDSSTYGWQEADVIDSSGNVLQQLFVNTTDDKVWIQMTFDLSQYAGQSIGIQFLDHEDSGGGSYYTYMYVDDVSLTVS